jgi:predicted TIM-barrel fold metal-dependent hydrolase
VALRKFPPDGSCDCHVHVIGPKARFPLARKRGYTPPDAPAGALRRMLDELGLSRVVLVQPSIYGSDNDCLLAALDELGPMARAVVVLAPDTPGTTLDALHGQGVRGIRVNLASTRTMSPADVRQRFREAARLGERNGWHVQAFIPATMLVDMPDLADLPVPLVVDHFGLIPPERPHGPEAAAVLSLLDSGRLWVKLSAPYRITERFADPAVATLARLLARKPERVVWGSDWPHTPPQTGSASEEETPYRDLSTNELLAQVRVWFPDFGMQQRLLVDNPARLYGWT